MTLLSSDDIVERPLTRAAWDTVLRSDADALVTQSPHWAAALTRVGGWTDASRMFETPHGRIVVPIMRKKWSSAIGGIDESMRYGFGGLLTEPGVGAEDVAPVLAILGRERRMRLSIRPNPLHDAAWRDAAGWKTVPRCAHIVDLAGGSDAVLGRMRGSARRGIRRAQEAGVKITCDATGDSLPAFFELMYESRERWATKSHEPIWLARWRTRADSLERWRTISSVLDGRCRVYTATWEGEIVAAIIVLFGPNAHYTRGAMRRDPAAESRANYALHWEAMQDAANAGFRWYTMGESGTSSSLAAFKSHFGAAAYRYQEYRHELFPISEMDRRARSLVQQAVGFREAR